jgi:hypothetical protein
LGENVYLKDLFLNEQAQIIRFRLYISNWLKLQKTLENKRITKAKKGAIIKIQSFSNLSTNKDIIIILIDLNQTKQLA